MNMIVEIKWETRCWGRLNYIPSQKKKRLQHTDALTISIIYHFNRTWYTSICSSQWWKVNGLLILLCTPSSLSFPFSPAIFDSIHSMYNRNHQSLYIVSVGVSRFPLVMLAVRRSPGVGAADGGAQSLGQRGRVRVAVENGLLRGRWRRPALGGEGTPAAGLLVLLLHVKTKNETNRHHNACCEKKENKKKASNHSVSASQSVRRDSCTWTHMSVWWIRIRRCLLCSPNLCTGRRVPTRQRPLDG